MVSAGQTATATVTVTESNIAKTMKSGSLEVFATPAMCALMEEAAAKSTAIFRRWRRHCRYRSIHYSRGRLLHLVQQ